jgi:hypothetical protein
MQFTANIDYTKLSQAFAKIPIAAARELRSELNKGLRAIQVDARLHHKFKPHSGQLERSIQEDVEGSGLSGKVWLEESVAPYGKYQHDGTQEHFVKPINRKALYFVKSGQKFFSKGHMVSGIKKDEFLYKAFARQKPFFLARINGAVSRIFEAAGLK